MDERLRCAVRELGNGHGHGHGINRSKGTFHLLTYLPYDLLLDRYSMYVCMYGWMDTCTHARSREIIEARMNE